MEKTSLQQLEQSWLELQSILNEQNGEIIEEQEKEFDHLSEAICLKKDSYIYVRENLKSQIEQGKFWIKKFQDKVKSLERHDAQLTQRLLDNMIAMNENVFEGELGKIRRQKSVSVNIINEDAVPDDFKEVVLTTKISKTDIKNALKEGKEIPGAELVESEHIRIY